MVATLRAGLTVVMLLGFYVLALVQLVAVGAFAYWLARMLPGLLALKLTWPVLVGTVGAVGVALWRTIRNRPDPPTGLALGPGDAPELWDALHGLAAEVGTRVPDELRLVPEVNAAVVEESRLLGLIAGRRYLYLGVPLLQGLTVAQLFAVLAHELGHYSHGHTSLAEVAYRGRIAIGETLARIGRKNPLGWAFRGYALLYLLVDHAVVRRQELEADRAAVRVAGRAAAAGALRETHVIDAAWAFYFSRYVEPGWRAGYAPDELFGGFGHLLVGRREELAGLRRTVPSGKRSRWDTHPPLAERVAAIATAPVRGAVADDRPAAVLLPGLDDACRRLQAAMVDTDGRTVLSWPELNVMTAASAAEHEVAEALTAMGHAVGAPAPLGLASVFDLIEAGRLQELAQPLFPLATRRELPHRLAAQLVPLLELAAVRSGAAHFRHSWSGPAEVINVVDGLPLELGEVARLAVAPATMHRARRRLAALGIDLASVTGADPADTDTIDTRPTGGAATGGDPTGSDATGTGSGGRETTAGATVLGGLANIKADGVVHDLLVLDTGLVLLSEPGPSREGKERLIELIRTTPVVEIIERHRYIPYADIVAARITKKIPLRGELELSDGRRVELHEPWTSQNMTDQSREALVYVLESAGARTD